MSPDTGGNRRHPGNSTFPKGTGRGVTSHGTKANDRLCRRLPMTLSPGVMDQVATAVRFAFDLG